MDGRCGLAVRSDNFSSVLSGHTGKPLVQPTAHYASELFERRIREYAGAPPGHSGPCPRPLLILEAGCGRRWTLDLSGVDFRLIGVDLNADAIRMRADLNESIIGDLRTVTLPAEAYDVVYCSFVLEHVAGAERVLDRMAAATRPGGLLLVRIPDRDSVFGFLTRHSPYRLHVQYHRRIRRHKLAGTPGRGPYPCIYDKVVSWQGMTSYCATHGLEIIEACSSNFYLGALGPFAGITDRTLRLMATLSAGRLTADHNNLAFVIRKPADPSGA